MNLILSVLYCKATYLSIGYGFLRSVCYLVVIESLNVYLDKNWKVSSIHFNVKLCDFILVLPDKENQSLSLFEYEIETGLRNQKRIKVDSSYLLVLSHKSRNYNL